MTVTSLIFLCLLTFPTVFQKNGLFANLKESFLESFFACFPSCLFILRNGFHSVSCLNSLLHALFSILIHNWLVVLRYVYVKHILFYHASWLQFFHFLKLLFIQVKALNHFEIYAILPENIQIIWIPILEIWLFLIFIIIFHLFVITFTCQGKYGILQLLYFFLPLITCQYHSVILILTFGVLRLLVILAYPSAEAKWAWLT